MGEETLFEMEEAEEKEVAGPRRREEVRVVRPNRQQLQMAPRDLEAELPQEHPARTIWGYLEGLELGAFYEEIKATVDHAGRPATDPQVLLALWVLATVEGVGSARRLDRLCREHSAYRWLCGGVPINYHMLSDFRVGHQEALVADPGCGDAAGGGCGEAGAGGARLRVRERRGGLLPATGPAGSLAEARAQVKRLALDGSIRTLG